MWVGLLAVVVFVAVVRLCAALWPSGQRERVAEPPLEPPLRYRPPRRLWVRDRELEQSARSAEVRTQVRA